MHLNPEQQLAVQTSKGRVLVLAGAGSGKTSVIINRIARLITEDDVHPTRILGLTFTNKAAGEMRERVAKKIGLSLAEELTLSTFHSFCFQVLKKEIHHLGYTSQFTLYDERDMRRLVQTLAKQDVGDINLEEYLKAYNAVDFDGLLTLTVRLFEEHPRILETYQEKFLYIMIDEYQDTNPIQYRLASLLCKRYNNFFVVGDDDQSIYGWRGSQVEHILEFQHDTIVKLEQNYRSTPNILHAANAVIQHNRKRHPKTLWSNQHHGEPVHIFHAPSETEEIRSVIDRILYLRTKKNIPFSEMAILYRSNSLARAFEMALMQTSYKLGDTWMRHIPYDIVQGTEFFARAEVKDLFAYMRVMVNPKDGEALLRIINYPRRGISPKTVEMITTFSKEKDITLWEAIEHLSRASSVLSQRAQQALLHFLTIIRDVDEMMTHHSLLEGLECLLKTIRYRETIEEDTKSDKAREAKLNNIGLVAELLQQYQESNISPSLADFLAGAMLDHQKAKHAQKNTQDDRLQLLTFHSAKGLEFTACFLVALEDNIIPHEKSLLETGIEEERRLMYVAMTRAKRYLTLSMARSRMRYGKTNTTNPSRFLFEIPTELIKTCSYRGPITYEN